MRDPRYPPDSQNWTQFSSVILFSIMLGHSLKIAVSMLYENQ
jgi:hypothetical protein